MQRKNMALALRASNGAAPQRNASLAEPVFSAAEMAELNTSQRFGRCIRVFLAILEVSNLEETTSFPSELDVSAAPIAGAVRKDAAAIRLALADAKNAIYAEPTLAGQARMADAVVGVFLRAIRDGELVQAASKVRSLVRGSHPSWFESDAAASAVAAGCALATTASGVYALAYVHGLTLPVACAAVIPRAVGHVVAARTPGRVGPALVRTASELAAGALTTHAVVSAPGLGGHVQLDGGVTCDADELRTSGLFAGKSIDDVRALARGVLGRRLRLKFCRGPDGSDALLGSLSDEALRHAVRHATLAAAPEDRSGSSAGSVLASLVAFLPNVPQALISPAEAAKTIAVASASVDAMVRSGMRRYAERRSSGRRKALLGGIEAMRNERSSSPAEDLALLHAVHLQARGRGDVTATAHKGVVYVLHGHQRDALRARLAEARQQGAGTGSAKQWRVPVRREDVTNDGLGRSVNVADLANRHAAAYEGMPKMGPHRAFENENGMRVVYVPLSSAEADFLSAHRQLPPPPSRVHKRPRGSNTEGEINGGTPTPNVVRVTVGRKRGGPEPSSSATASSPKRARGGAK
jgi:hypothetical protein